MQRLTFRGIALVTGIAFGILGSACGKTVARDDEGDRASGGASASGATMNVSASGGEVATGGVTNATGGAPPATRPLADLVAEPGWKESATPVCEEVFVPLGYDLWADERGVFLLAKRECFGFLNHAGGCDDGAFSVWFNDGTGWKSYYAPELGANAHALEGTPNGPVWVVGAKPSGDYCGLLELNEDGTGFCAEGSGSESTIFGLSANEAYVCINRTLSKYDGAGFEELATVESYFSPTFLWADEDVLYAASMIDLFRKLPSSTEVERLEPPDNYADAPEIRALWGFGEQDLWLARGTNLYHFDGESWSLPLVAPNVILHLWGDDGVLYVATQHDFGRVRNGAVEWLVNETDAEVFLDMWGTSVDSVFLAVAHDGEPYGVPCGSVSAYWFDGAKLHEF